MSSLAALAALRHVQAQGRQLVRGVERLASGRRINRAADDAAGLSVGEKLRAQARGLAQAQRNAQDGISLVQTAEGALSQVHGTLQRMRELSTQAANDTVSDADRGVISAELQQLRSEVDGIQARTTFNGRPLLGPAPAAPPPPPPPIRLDASSELTDGETLTWSGDSAVVNTIDVSGARPGEGYKFRRIGGNDLELKRQSDGVRQTITVANITAGASGLLDFNLLGVRITLTAAGGMSGSNIARALDDSPNDTLRTAAAPPAPPTGTGSINFQVGGEAEDGYTLDLPDVSMSTLSLTAALDDFDADRSVGNAQTLISLLDGAISQVSTERSRMGAVQNRLEHSIANLGVAHENALASESRVWDADMAEAMVRLTRTRLVQDVGTAVLAQANQQPKLVLSLLA